MFNSPSLIKLESVVYVEMDFRGPCDVAVKGSDWLGHIVKTATETESETISFH